MKKFGVRSSECGVQNQELRMINLMFQILRKEGEEVHKAHSS
jgi:hypothetical protein